MTNESFILRGDFKKMDRANKYIIIRHFNDSVSVEFMDASNDKALLSQIGCSENAMDYEDLDKFSEYLESFKKPYDKLTEADFIKSIDSTEHNIQFIIEVNSERYVYRNKK
jgi:hypothetical protein